MNWQIAVQTIGIDFCQKNTPTKWKNMRKSTPQNTTERQNSLKMDLESKISNVLSSAQGLGVDEETAKNWIGQVLYDTVKVNSDENYEPSPPEPIAISKEISIIIVAAVLKILATRFAIRDNGLYFLSDVGAALGVDPAVLRKLLDTQHEAMRDNFTQTLLDELDTEQCYWCALILMKIICVDDYVHPAEEVYFNAIARLTGGEMKDLIQFKMEADKVKQIPKLELDPVIADSILTYLITIAMCDGEYVDQESMFIKQAAQSLGIETTKIDTILQPVASAYMVIQSLFPLESAST